MSQMRNRKRRKCQSQHWLVLFISLLAFLVSLPLISGDEFVYVSNYIDKTISKINITDSNNTEVSRTSVGWAYRFPASQYWDGEVMWVENMSSEEIVVFNLTDFSVIGRLDLSLYGMDKAQVSLIEMQLTPDGKRLYAATESNDIVYVVNSTFNSTNQPNLTVLAKIRYNTTPSTEHPCDISTTPDGKYVFTSDEHVEKVSAINTSKIENLIGSSNSTVSVSIDEVAYRIPLNLSGHGDTIAPHRVTVSPWLDYKYVFTGNIIDMTVSIINYSDPDPAKWAEVRFIDRSASPNEFRPLKTEFTPDGSYAYVPEDVDGIITVVNLSALYNDSANMVSTTIYTGSPVHITFSPDGKFAYAENRDENKISVINTSSHTIIANISVGNNPRGLISTPPHRYDVSYPHDVSLTYPSEGKFFTSNENIHLNALTEGSTEDWYWSTGIKNVSLWFNGSYYMWHRHPEIDESGKGGTYVFNLSYLNLDYGEYNWNVQMFEGTGIEMWGTSNRTFKIGSNPLITINSPINESYISDSTTTLKATEIEDDPDTMWYSFDGGDNITSCPFRCTSKEFEVTIPGSWTLGSGGDAWEGNATLENITTDENGDVILDGQNDLDANTTLLMHMNEGEGSFANDSSNNANNGTINGSTWASGKFGTALAFDGADDYVKVPYSESLNITDEITMMAWIYRNSSSDAYLIYKGDSTETNMSYGLFLNPYGSNFGLAIFWGSSWYDGGWDIPLNQWTHIAGTYNGSYARIYINGVHNFTSTLDTTPIGTNNFNLSIGGLFGSSYPFKGTIDEVHIINRALNQTEISDYYNITYSLVGNLTSIISDASTVEIADPGATFKQASFEGNLSEGTNVSIYVNTSSDNVSWSGQVLVKENATSGIAYPISTTYQKRYASLRLELRTNDTSITPTIFNSTFTAGLSDGPHNATVYANDTLGFENSKTTWFTVDTTLPVVNITYPANASYDFSGMTINLTYNETNMDSCFYSLNSAGANSTITSCLNGTLIKAKLGVNVLKVYVNDSAGNTGYDTKYFTAARDTSPPIITIGSPQNTTYNTTAIDLSVSADEENLTWWYSLNSGSNTTFTPNATITGASGSNSLIVHSNDSAGNINSSTVLFTVTLPSKKTPAPSGGGRSPILAATSATITMTSDDFSRLIREFRMVTTQFYSVGPELGGVLGALDYMPTSPGLSEKISKVTSKRVLPLNGDIYNLASEHVLRKFDEADKVIISRGDLGVDSISSIAYARALEVPILLVEPGGIPQVTIETFERLSTNNTIILGGPVAVSEDVEALLPNPIMRIGGQDRFYTAVKIALALMRETQVDTIVVTDGRNPDIMSVMVAANYKAPIIYVDGDDVPEITKEFFVIKPKTVEKVLLVGVSEKSQEKLGPFLP